MNQEFIRFEGDVLRSHTSYRLPLKCIIEGNAYRVAEWTVAGVVMAETPPGMESGGTYQIGLTFPLDGCEFVLDMEAVALERGGRWELVYASPSQSQVNIFRYLLDAYLTGDLVTVGEIIDIQKRAPDESADLPGMLRASSRTERAVRVIWRLTWLLLVVITVAGLGAFVVGGISERLSLIPSETAMVIIDTLPAYAAEAGVVTNFASGSVAAGQPLATVMTPAHNSTTIFSPCDCTISTPPLAIGSSVSAGQEIAQLREDGAKPKIVAWVTRERLMDIYRGAVADVELPTGESLRGLSLGTLPLVNPSKVRKGDLVPVEVLLPADAPLVSAGEPVLVRFLRTNSAPNMTALDKGSEAVGRLVQFVTGK